ncbi:unnamed protein product [Lactuca virosa]|uniref:Uncharacterized protein n=1 Tax=Lactuca virosa TaxID=75947 RepID=A0AAU9MWL8_9ASTR|nr:unnamed protein product [Lactuca virosa]
MHHRSPSSAIFTNSDFRFHHFPSPSVFQQNPVCPNNQSTQKNLKLRPEYHTISSELKALTKMVQENLRGSTDTKQVSNAAYRKSSLLERGKLYEEYSARRNKRLKRKRGESEVEKIPRVNNILGLGMSRQKKQKSRNLRVEGR